MYMYSISTYMYTCMLTCIYHTHTHTSPGLTVWEHLSKVLPAQLLLSPDGGGAARGGHGVTHPLGVDRRLRLCRIADEEVQVFLLPDG